MNVFYSGAGPRYVNPTKFSRDFMANRTKKSLRKNGFGLLNYINNAIDYVGDFGEGVIEGTAKFIGKAATHFGAEGVEETIEDVSGSASKVWRGIQFFRDIEDDLGLVDLARREAQGTAFDKVYVSKRERAEMEQEAFNKELEDYRKQGPTVEEIDTDDEEEPAPKKQKGDYNNKHKDHTQYTGHSKAHGEQAQPYIRVPFDVDGLSHSGGTDMSDHPHSVPYNSVNRAPMHTGHSQNYVF